MLAIFCAGIFSVSCGSSGFKGAQSPSPAPTSTPEPFVEKPEVKPAPITGSNVVSMKEAPGQMPAASGPVVPVSADPVNFQTTPQVTFQTTSSVPIQISRGTAISGPQVATFTSSGFTGNGYAGANGNVAQRRVQMFTNVAGNAAYSIRATASCTSSSALGGACGGLDFPGHGYQPAADVFGVFTLADANALSGGRYQFDSVAVCHRSVSSSSPDVLAIPAPANIDSFALSPGCSSSDAEIFYTPSAGTPGAVPIYKWTRLVGGSTAVSFSKLSSGVPGYILSSATPAFYAIP